LVEAVLKPPSGFHQGTIIAQHIALLNLLEIQHPEKLGDFFSTKWGYETTTMGI
jgi:hypothetical protein